MDIVKKDLQSVGVMEWDGGRDLSDYGRFEQIRSSSLQSGLGQFALVWSSLSGLTLW